MSSTGIGIIILCSYSLPACHNAFCSTSVKVLEGSTVVVTVVVVITITVLCGWILHQHCHHLNMSVTLFSFKCDIPMWERYTSIGKTPIKYNTLRMLVLLCYTFWLVHIVISRLKVTKVEMLCKIPYLLYNVYIHGQISNYTSQIIHNKLTFLITRSVCRTTLLGHYSPRLISWGFETLLFYRVMVLASCLTPSLAGQGTPFCLSHYLWPVWHGRPYQ